MRRTALHRLTVTALVMALLAGSAGPALGATKPVTKAAAAAIVRGEVFTAKAAAQRAAKLFFLVRLPANALPQKGDEAPGTASPDSLDADLWTATLGHWWRTPGSVKAVTAWLVKHPPTGFVSYGSGSAPGSRTLLFQPISAKAGCCATLEATVDSVGKHTAISFAAFVQWQPRRAEIEHIPATVSHALLEVGSDPTQTIPSFPNTSVEVADPAIAPLVAALNAMAPTREQPMPCPYTPNWSKATFRYGDRVVVFASPSSCPYVEVTVDGANSQTLSGNITDLVAQILGVTAVGPAM